MCSQPVNFKSQLHLVSRKKWTAMEQESVDAAFARLLEEAREFRELANSLPSRSQKPDIAPTPAHLRWRN